LAHPKTLAPSKSADAKTLAHPEFLADAKKLAHGKILASTEMLAHRKNWAPASVRKAGKVGGPTEELHYCLGSAESATAGFSQEPLMVSFSSFLMC
jgi:hypothetical protein